MARARVRGDGAVGVLVAAEAAAPAQARAVGMRAAADDGGEGGCRVRGRRKAKYSYVNALKGDMAWECMRFLARPNLLQRRAVIKGGSGRHRHRGGAGVT